MTANIMRAGVHSSPTERGIRCARRVLSLASVFVLASCAAGPDFVAPHAPDVHAYTSERAAAVLDAGTEDSAQRVAMGQAVSAQWWSLFHSRALDDVVRRAIAGNRTLAAAQATLAQAQQAVIQARGGFYPQIDLSANASRQQASASRSLSGVSFGGSGAIYNLYSLGPTVSYAPDAFGLTRRRVEQQQALAAAQRYQLAAAYLTLTGNTVTQAINIASARLQLDALREILAEDERNLALVRQKFEAGKAARTDVLTAESQLAGDQALVPPLRQQVSAARHALSILAGRFPGDWSPPDFDLAQLALPGELPVSLPSALVRQRPDILAAEAQLHAASAAIGVATAALYPSITLSGTVSLQSLSTGTLFRSSSEFWSLASGVTAPIFHGGALEAQKQGAIEAFKASAATYQQTVLQAFGQVADTLRALAHDAELVAAQHRALEISSAALKLQRVSYEVGKTNLLQLLDAERAYQQARLGYARAQAQRYQDTAQLFVAMGGGWWNAKHPILDSAARETPER